MDTRLMQQIKAILKEFPQYWDGEELQRPIVINDLKSYDALLISALLKNQKIRENYSVKAGDVVIFKVQEFIDILRYKDYWADSYTKYSNTIGLSSEGKYLQYNTDVVLDFPYKDCVLEGGMTKEDVGKEEIFYNEVIARDEIDTLFAPKALVNVKKYDVKGKHDVDSFSSEDNLIIKGNNLLALHSLKERYAGKVKLIIIDPPYYFSKEKGSDSFNYNSNFKLSTWLTFMKNRLGIASTLMGENGTIFIVTGEEGYAYLKITCDEIFGLNKYVGTISWRKSDNQANIGEFAKVTDYILIYKKESAALSKLPLTEKAKKEYRYSDEKGKFRRAILLHKTRGRYIFDLETPSGKVLKGPWMKSKSDILNADKRGEIYWTKGGDEQPYGKIYLHNSKGQIANDFWDTSFGSNQRGSEEMMQLFNGRKFDFPKPELLIKNLISLGSNENDIVLDFFMGSATTQAVAMKMNRRFIGIEQMNYINTVSVPRLQKVIEGEQGGISKDVNWQGGGSFVYAELMELNQTYMDKIDRVSTREELVDLWDELDNKADLNFQLDKEKLTNELLKEYDEEAGSITFNDLTFEEQKEIFKKALDKNQLYVPYSEIEDKNVVISDSDKAFNHSFYNGEEE
ncbi:site-specific DNA-methyltransferase [Enterococcus ratti]|uniref:DNA methyltransferase n=1 Tax=Enterococcus ratti TaxID=150033 RepID=UPI003517643C